MDATKVEQRHQLSVNCDETSLPQLRTGGDLCPPKLELTVTVELDIVRLGAQGDGIADTGNGPRYVPFALPGERVRLLDDAIPEVVSGAQQRSRGSALPSLRHLRRLRRAAHERPALRRLEAQHRHRRLAPARTSGRRRAAAAHSAGLAPARGADGLAQEGRLGGPRLSPAQEQRTCRHRGMPDPDAGNGGQPARPPGHCGGHARTRDAAHGAADARRIGHLHQPRRSSSRPGGRCRPRPDCRGTPPRAHCHQWRDPDRARCAYAVLWRRRCRPAARRVRAGGGGGGA